MKYFNKNTFRVISFSSLFFVISLLQGCDLYPQDEYKEQFVVESYLIAQQPMPKVRLSTTAPFNEPYYFEERAVQDAEVRIHRYDRDGTRKKTYHYKETEPGVYKAGTSEKNDLILPKQKYRLDIRIPLSGGKEHLIESETVVPDTFSVREIIRDRAAYQSPEPLEFRISRNRVDNRQLFFIYATEALDPSPENLTPFWRDVVEDPEEAIRIRTNIVNEENFDINADGTLTLRMPWIGIAFYGRNIISTFSIDDNAYDYFRSEAIQTGGGPGTLSPGEIQNILYNIDGGIGLFASMSVLDIEVYVLPPEQR